MFKKNKMFKYGVYLLSVVLVSTLFSACQQKEPPFECADAIGCVDIAPGEPIKIGVILAQSKGPTDVSAEQERIIELVLAQRDEQLLGRPIKLQVEDGLCTSEGGAIATLRITADPQTVAILGPTCSGAATTASKVMSEAGLVMVGSSHGAASLTSLGGKPGDAWYPGYFRTSSSNAAIGQAAAAFAFQELGLTRVATINDGDAFTKGRAQLFEQVLSELGGEIVLSATINKGDTNMLPVLAAVAKSGAQALYPAAFVPEAIRIVQQLKDVDGLVDDAGQRSIEIIGFSLWLSDEFIDAVEEDGVGMYFVVRATAKETALNKLVSDYEARYGEPPVTFAYPFAYDAINLLLDAIQTVTVQEKDGTLHIGRQALRDLLYATSDFEGVSGNLSCDEFGDCGFSTVRILRLDDPSAGVAGVRSNVVYTYTPGE